MIKQRKRFIDSALFDAGWFLSLDPDQRLFWIQIQARCDCIGQLDIDGERIYAERMHGLEINPDEFLKAVNGQQQRIRDLGNGRWWLTNFIREQYGQLNPESRPHKRYIKDLHESGLWETFISENPDLKPTNRVSIDYQYPKHTPEEKEKEKDKAQDRDSTTTGMNGHSQYDPSKFASSFKK